MHDSLGQVLGYVSAQTLAAKRFLTTGQTEQALQELAQMAERVQEVYADVREGILGLRTSSSFSEEGFVPAFRLYCDPYSEMS
ncbi:MAG: histidine kinase, partial [Chloroflexi bacterium]|nr:histidine kinase [Chloroflexota bacterium]